MAQVGAVNIKIGADAVDFRAALSQASASVADFRNQFKSAFDSLKGSAEKPYGAFSALNSALAASRRQMQDLLAVGAKVPEELVTKYRTLKSTIDQVNGAMKETPNAPSGGGLGASIAANLNSYAAGFLSITAAADGLRKTLQITSDFQRIDTALRAVSKSSVDYTRTQTLLRAASDSLALSYESLASSYKGVKAATEGTRLEGIQAERIFLSVVRASAALQLSADDTQGALRALTQMMSTGTIQADELKNELGNRIPGATKLMAQALGVTQQEMFKMMEAGQLLAEDVLPKFAIQLEKSFGSKAESNVNTMSGAMTRLTDQTKLLIAEFAQSAGVDSFFGKMGNGFANTLRGLRELVRSGEWGQFFLAFSPLGGFSARSRASALGAQSAQVQQYSLMNPESRLDARNRLGSTIQRQQTVIKAGVSNDATLQELRNNEALLREMRVAELKLTAAERKAATQSFKAEPVTFDKLQEKLKGVKGQIEDLMAQGKTWNELPKSLTTNYNKLNAQIEAIEGNFRKAKTSQVKLLDISNVAIYRRELEKILKLDPGNVNKIFNLKNLIRKEQGQEQLEVGIKLKMPERFDAGGQLTSSLVSPLESITKQAQFFDKINNVPLKLATRDLLIENGFDPEKQRKRYQDAVDQIKNLFGVDKVKTTIDLFNRTIQQGFNLEDARERLLQLKSVLRDIPDTFSGLKDAIAQNVDKFDPFGDMSDKVMEAGERLAQAFRSAKEAAMQDAGGLLLGIGEAIGGGGDILKATLQGVLNLIANYVATVGQALLVTSGLFAASGITAPLAIENAIAGGAMIVGAGVIRGLASAIPKFADGGIVSGPTFGLIGEYPGARTGNPEVIAPLDKLKSMIGSGGGTQVFIPDVQVRGSDLRIIFNRAQSAHVDKNGSR